VCVRVCGIMFVVDDVVLKLYCCMLLHVVLIL
jgi:hypothetical protein